MSVLGEKKIERRRDLQNPIQKMQQFSNPEKHYKVFCLGLTFQYKITFLLLFQNLDSKSKVLQENDMLDHSVWYKTSRS